MMKRVLLFTLMVVIAGALAAAARGGPRLLTAATPIASPVALPTGGSVSVAAFVTIHLTDGGFDPQSVEATNGHDLTITLVNSGTRPHAFRVDQFAIDIRLDPGQTTTVVIHAPGFGDFPYYSDLPGDDGHVGKITFYI